MTILEMLVKALLGGGFKYFLCSPLLGEDSHFVTNIFQIGWNDQPVYLGKNTIAKYVERLCHVFFNEDVVTS